MHDWQCEPHHILQSSLCLWLTLRSLSTSALALALSCVTSTPSRTSRSSRALQISAAQRDKVLSFVEDAVAAGATLATGGKLFDTEGANTDGFFVEPTVLTGVTNGMRVAREEVRQARCCPSSDVALMESQIFGPVLAVLKYETEEEAIALANNSEYVELFGHILPAC